MKRRQTYETLPVLALLAVLLFTASEGQAQRTPFRVFLADKGPGVFAPGEPLYEQTLLQYHPNAIRRRTLAGMDPVLDELDRPIHDDYRKQVLAISDSLLSSNPWMNYMVVGLTQDEYDRVKALECVRAVSPANSISYRLTLPERCAPVPETFQSEMLRVGNVHELHDAGVFGQGARIGVIDNGFRWKAMSSLSHVNVEDEYDFIHRRPITANQDNDVPLQDEHGSVIMSVAAAWYGDQVMGVAPFSTYLLAKSEDMRYERRIEEDLYVEALWWVERSGADISSSSLGYRFFDSTDAATPYELLNGSTTFPARAINIASQRGMICLTAAGNSGPSSRTIITPADADSALAIGGIALDGRSAWSNSSWGPSASGRQKPEFAAPAERVPVQQVNGLVGRASGTSLATPYVAAQVALLRQLYPAVHPSYIRQAMIEGSRFGRQTDSVLGHGALDVARAARILGPSIAEPATVITAGGMVVLAPIFAIDTLKPMLYQRANSSAPEIAIEGEYLLGDWYAFRLNEAYYDGNTAQVRIVAPSQATKRTAVYPPGAEGMLVKRAEVSIPCGMRIPSIIVSVDDKPEMLTQVRVAGMPLARHSRTFDLFGLDTTPLSVRITNAVTGATYACEMLGHDQDRLSVMTPSALSVGTWVLECRLPDAVVHCSLIVL